MNSNRLRNIQGHLRDDARPIDVALFDHFFFGGDRQAVLDQLQAFQNDDGGFGHALEPDLRLPQSTALASWLAFRIMGEVDTDRADAMLQRGLRYLLDTYEPDRQGWAIVRPEVDNHPHAPWWSYESAMVHFGWGNPSAELLGFLIKYADASAANTIATLSARAVERLHEVDPADFHEVFNLKALHDLADEELRRQLHEPLGELILRAVSIDPDAWSGYVATPLSFLTSPDDPFSTLFDERLILKNLEFVGSSMIDGTHWDPNWNWSGTYPNEWPIAKREWSGTLTVRNMKTLRDFGAISD